MSIMWMRDTAEYTYIQQWIASEFPANVFVVDTWKYSRDYVECSKKSRIINVTADGGNEIASPSTLGHWKGIEVWVGDRNVYGTDCQAVTSYKYTVDSNKSGLSLIGRVQQLILDHIRQKTIRRLFGKRILQQLELL